MNTVTKLSSDRYPRVTRAAILVAQQQPLVIDEIELPEHLDVGQVLVELDYSGICGSQLGEIDGVKGPDKWLPHLLGHEASGTVLAVGPGVRHVKPGDVVVAHWKPALGIESSVPQYRWRSNTVNAGWVTTFNRHAVISENRLTPIPAGTDRMAAALFGCAITTGFGLIDNQSDLRLGEDVVVFGAGGIGLNIVQAAHLAGARKVVAVDLFDNRLALALRCGASEVINAAITDPWAQLKEMFAERAPDVFIDNTGKPEVIARGYELVNSKGRVLLVGVPNKGANTTLYTLPMHFGKHVCGTHGGETQPHHDIPRYMGLAASRQINFGDLITQVKPLNSINELIEGMRDGSTAGRCMVDLAAEDAR
jgi:S-(hydroxymethyl)glutathione dehydrogenase/alcohol dehydrogenase